MKKKVRKRGLNMIDAEIDTESVDTQNSQSNEDEDKLFLFDEGYFDVS